MVSRATWPQRGHVISDSRMGQASDIVLHKPDQIVVYQAFIHQDEPSDQHDNGAGSQFAVNTWLGMTPYCDEPRERNKCGRCSADVVSGRGYAAKDRDPTAPKANQHQCKRQYATGGREQRENRTEQSRL